jgi:hypothetical protein
VFLGFSAMLAFSHARAAGPVCAKLDVEADSEVRAAWPELEERVREAFAARDDVDRCARVRLGASGGSVAVDVRLPDGRSAARTSVPEDVIATLAALVLVPRLEESAGATDALPAKAAPPAPLRRKEVPAENAAREVASPAHLGFELSAMTGARAGDGLVGIGLGAQSFVSLRGWLMGFQGRADKYGPLGGAALELAVLGGRRIPFGSRTIDLYGGPSISLQGSSRTTKAAPANGTSRPPPDASTSETSQGLVPRFTAAARMNFSAHSVVRTFVGVEGEVGATVAPGTSPPPDGRRLPVWVVGLALGATVGTP